MKRVPVRPARAEDAAWVRRFLRHCWGDTAVAVHGELIDAALLPALIAGDRQGLATYRLSGREAELVTLNAEPADAGTGTALIEALARRLRDAGVERLWLTTTNGHPAALQFYQRRGFRLVRVRPGAVDEARRLKPSIPVIGEDGAPVRDELDLCLVLGEGT
jgi:GNAT superfamily N-acetyltransferase